MSPCSTPATMSKYSVSPSGDRTFTLVFLDVACRFFTRTPSRILRMVNICEVVDQFLRKPFWFFSKYVVDFGFYAVS